MLRSTTTVRSQEKSALNVSNLKQLQKQRTATSNRTGGASSSAQTSTGHKVTADKIKPRVTSLNTNLIVYHLLNFIFLRYLMKIMSMSRLNQCLKANLLLRLDMEVLCFKASKVEPLL